MKYYLRRTLRIPATILAVATLTFGLIRLLPGGPFTQLRLNLLQQGIPAEQVDARIEALQNIRPDAPLWQQYIDYMVGVVQLDLGQSISLGEPVVAVLARALPWTVFLVVTSTLLMFVIGVPIVTVVGLQVGTLMGGAVLHLRGAVPVLPGVPARLVPDRERRRARR